MKEQIVGTYLGAKLLGLRSWFSLRSIPVGNPEQASMIANGILADRLIAALPANGTRVLDIGAHIGSVFSAVHRTNSSVQITAIEAEEEKAKKLKARFPYSNVLSFAVGEEDGTATFNVMEKSGYNSLAHEKVEGMVTQKQVELRRLDSLFPDDVFDTVKIDIEGAELGAFRGGVALFKRSRPTIMFESAEVDENSLGYSAEKLFDWFSGNDFEVICPDRLAHDAPPLTKAAFQDAHAYPQRTLNFFAVPTEKREEVRRKAREILGIQVSNEAASPDTSSATKTN